VNELTSGCFIQGTYRTVTALRSPHSTSHWNEKSIRRFYSSGMSRE